MRARDGDRGRRGIEADDFRAEARQRLRQQAAAAADVEHPQAGERRAGAARTAEMAGDRIAQPDDADRTEPVQRRHRPVGVPPPSPSASKRATSSPMMLAAAITELFKPRRPNRR